MRAKRRLRAWNRFEAVKSENIRDQSRVRDTHVLQEIPFPSRAPPRGLFSSLSLSYPHPPSLYLAGAIMGLSISSLFTSLSSLVRWSKDQDVRILMLGLDSAGKVSNTWSAPTPCPYCSCLDFVDHYTVSSSGMLDSGFWKSMSDPLCQIGEVVSTIPSTSYAGIVPLS